MPRGRFGFAGPALFALTLLAIVVLVGLPLWELVASSLGAGEGLTTKYLLEVFRSRQLLAAIGSSVLLGAVCAAGSVVVGAPLAWLVSQTDLPLRTTFRIVILSGFVAPGFVNALAWILLAGPNAGLINKAWFALTGGFQPLVNIYSWGGLAFVSFATVYPLAFILIYNAFQLQDTEVDEAARVLGAGRLRILLTITLPLALPAIAASFLLCALEAIILYGAPAVVGAPAGVSVVTTALFHLFDFPPQVSLASALSLVLLLLTAGLLLLQGWITRKGSRATIRGKGGRMRRARLGWARWPVFAAAAAVVGVTIVLPYAEIVGTAFLTKFYLGFTWSNLTLANFHYIFFEFPSGPLGIRNSLVTSTISATAAVLLGGVAAYLVVRRIVPLRQILAFLATAPIVIPGMVMAIAAYALYSSGPFMLVGTIWILAIVYAAKFLPFAYTSCAAAVANVHDDLEGAARVIGATRLQVLRDITAPLVRSGITSAWILAFVPAMKELSASVLLYNSHTTVIATAIMDAYSVPSWEAVAALSTVLLALNAVIILAGIRLFGGTVLGRSN